ncbi:hypothetical protein M8009_13110 [Halomonas sp. ATCH28]|uniref:Uncharacterized protein n=1 Tax=Halomonas gemina TaxID=2945105 RepID=A0ABT0T3Z4_9GAMM|nr:hypothetical protein [Halomonas gemina]MCL7941226.1 hypothetical protein [Halomonas gemina]
MDWSSVGDALSAGFDTVSKYATKAFDWMGENPEATNLIGGVALGAAQGYMADKQAKDQRAFEREMYDKKREDRYAKPGEIGNYGSHRNAIAGKGLISGGMITGEE